MVRGGGGMSDIGTISGGAVAATQADLASDANAAAIVVGHNALLAAMKAAGMMVADLTYDQMVLGMTGLIACWEMGEASGNFADSLGVNTMIAHAAGMGGGTAPIVGSATTAGIFNPTGTKFASIGASSGLNHGNTFSYLLWLKLGAIGALQYLVGRDGAGGVNICVLDNNTIWLATAADVCARTSGTLTDTTGYHFIVVSKDAATSRKIYVDGSPAALGTDVDHTFSTGATDDLSLGGTWGGTSILTGNIGRVAVLNRAVTDGEVAALYARALVA